MKGSNGIRQRHLNTARLYLSRCIEATRIGERLPLRKNSRENAERKDCRQPYFLRNSHPLRSLQNHSGVLYIGFSSVTVLA